MSLQVEVTDHNRLEFASLSQDYNPLHVDHDYGAASAYGSCVMHGAYSACLFSRLAGMHLPGNDCLLHGMRLRFVNPIITPAKIIAEGVLERDDGEIGEVGVQIRDAISGQLYVEGSYQFGRHSISEKKPITLKNETSRSSLVKSKILVTGASGGLGGAVLDLLGERGITLMGSKDERLTQDDRLAAIESFLAEDISLDGIVHCGWPPPSSQGLLEIDDIPGQVDFHVTAPLCECLALAKLLSSKGGEGAPLILIGSSFAEPGRHAWRTPLYSISKSLLPSLVGVLNQELSAYDKKAIGVCFDILDGGMNSAMSAGVKQYHAERSPNGVLPCTSDAASHISWLLNSPGALASGSMIKLTGGALP